MDKDGTIDRGVCGFVGSIEVMIRASPVMPCCLDFCCSGINRVQEGVGHLPCFAHACAVLVLGSLFWHSAYEEKCCRPGIGTPLPIMIMIGKIAIVCVTFTFSLSHLLL